MKAALALILVASPALACDWTKRVETDPMDDARMCWVSSEAAGLAFYRRGNDRPNVSTDSAYPRPSITVRIDDNEAVRLGNNALDRQRALDALIPQLNAGTRIRTRIEDYPTWRDGDAEVCDLPALLASCAE